MPGIILSTNAKITQGFPWELEDLLWAKIYCGKQHREYDYSVAATSLSITKCRQPHVCALMKPLDVNAEGTL